MCDADDVLTELSRAGVYIIVSGQRLHWRCDPSRLPVPGSLFTALREQREGIRRILLSVPAGCRVPNVCGQLGICPREIEFSACSRMHAPKQGGQVAEWGGRVSGGAREGEGGAPGDRLESSTTATKAEPGTSPLPALPHG